MASLGPQSRAVGDMVAHGLLRQRQAHGDLRVVEAARDLAKVDGGALL